jgi:hypothetical protein
MAKRVWTYVGGQAGNMPPPAEKAAITAACERLMAEVLRPRFLPTTEPPPGFNSPFAIEGKWHGNKHRWFTRYRTGDPQAPAAGFDAPFAHLDYISQDCFELMWHRHTGAWHCVGERLSLTEALRRIETEPYFQPC